MKIPIYQKAIAISSGNEQESLPVVLAKGEGIDADQVVKIAQRFGVPVIENPTLAQLLDEISIDTEIPEALFRAVAAVIIELEK